MANSHIWNKIKSPIFVQAPMDDVTDTVFRQVIAKCGRPDIFFTEFVNVEGMMSKGRKEVQKRLEKTEIEKPIIAQIWGLNPRNYAETAKVVREMKFDGIDINMGCPQKDVVKTGACGALIKNPKLAKKIIKAVKSAAGNLPVSVKTRIGYDKIQTEEWIKFLLEQNIDALTIHLRTVKEMSKVDAHWEEMAKIVNLKNKMSPKTIIIGNGDIKSKEEGIEKYQKFGCDGIMIGRGILQNPWIFSGKKTEDITISEKLSLMKFHILLFEKTWGMQKDFNILKKFFKIYVSGFENAGEVREKFMKTKSIKEVKTLLLSWDNK